MKFALCLLAGHFSGDAAVYFVRQPVLAGHGFELEHVGEVFLQVSDVVRDVFVAAHDSLVDHDGLRRMAEHLSDVEVERPDAIALLKSEMGVASRFANDIHRRPLTLGDAPHVVKVFLLDKEAHSLLAFIGDDFLGRKRLVPNGELRHVDQSAAILHQFRQAVDVSGRAMVMDAHDGVHVLFAKGTNKVVGALLHLGVGTLHSVQLNAARIAARVDRGNGPAAQADAIVVTTDDNDFIPLGGRTFKAVALCSVAHTAGQHDYFVISILLTVFRMFESEHRTGDEGLSELVTEIRSAVRGFDKDLLGRLIKPLAGRHGALPRTPAVKARIGRHVDRRSGYWPRADTAAHTVADFPARSGRCSVERLDGCREIVCLCFQRNDALDVFHDEVIACRMVLRGKLFDDGAL